MEETKIRLLTNEFKIAGSFLRRIRIQKSIKNLLVGGFAYETFLKVLHTGRGFLSTLGKHEVFQIPWLKKIPTSSFRPPLMTSV